MRRRRADSPGTCRAWGWRSRSPGSGRRRSCADSLAPFRLAAAAEALEQAAEQEAPLRAVEDGDEALVDGRIGDEGAQRALALVDLRGDLLEIGQRGLEIARRLADARVGRLVLDEAAERALAAHETVAAPAHVARYHFQVLDHLLALAL